MWQEMEGGESKDSWGLEGTKEVAGDAEGGAQGQLGLGRDKRR